MEFLCMIIIIR
ncbi:Protein of unknown function [Bacillus mycoides]|nr:Protein of unknown function [Bacillus mycoides]SCM93248.1 Protein of unknown function [Bacillus mycoides]